MNTTHALRGLFLLKIIFGLKIVFIQQTKHLCLAQQLVPSDFNKPAEDVSGKYIFISKG